MVLLFVTAEEGVVVDLPPAKNSDAPPPLVNPGDDILSFFLCVCFSLISFFVVMRI